MATRNTKTVTIPEDKAEAVAQLLALLANGEAPAKVVEAVTAPPTRPAHEVVMEERGVKPARGSTVLTPEAIKAAARVLKSGKPEVIESPEGNGDHVLLFVTDKGNVRVQNTYTPKRGMND